MPQAACLRAFPIQYTEDAWNEGFPGKSLDDRNQFFLLSLKVFKMLVLPQAIRSN